MHKGESIGAERLYDRVGTKATAKIALVTESGTISKYVVVVLISPSFLQAKHLIVLFVF